MTTSDDSFPATAADRFARDTPDEPFDLADVIERDGLTCSSCGATRDRVERALTLIESFDPTSGATRARVFAADLRRVLEGTGG